MGRSLGHERNYSETVAAKIDEEVHNLVASAYNDVMNMLAENEQFLHNMANALLEEETIDHVAVENLYKYGTSKDPNATDDNKSALEIAKINLGYFAGYYNSEIQQRVNKLFCTTHPIFGSTCPTSEEAFNMGKNN